MAALATEQSAAADGAVDDLDEETPEEAAQAGPSSAGQTPVSILASQPPLSNHFAYYYRDMVVQYHDGHFAILSDDLQYRRISQISTVLAALPDALASP